MHRPLLRYTDGVIVVRHDVQVVVFVVQERQGEMQGVQILLRPM